MDSLAELSPALLAVAPRVVTEERRGGLVWVDARGLDAERIALGALEVLRGLGLSNVRAGVAGIAVVAEIAAAGAGETDTAPQADVTQADVTQAGTTVEAMRPASAAAPGVPRIIPLGSERAFLASLPIAVLGPEPPLDTLLEGIGVETCGDLAVLEGESIEVRLGAAGVRLWRLARADDERRLFMPIPRDLPHASLDWSDYALTDTERLLFSMNALLGTVCEKLQERGSLARAMTLDLALANRETISHALRAGRPTASRKTWLRLTRAALERMALPAGVVGLTLRATTLVADEGAQGDLFDRGFATAAATEAALASLAEDQGEVIVVPENTRHPLVERRTEWRHRDWGLGTGDSAERPQPRRERTAVNGGWGPDARRETAAGRQTAGVIPSGGRVERARSREPALSAAKGTAPVPTEGSVSPRAERGVLTVPAEGADRDQAPIEGGVDSLGPSADARGPREADAAPGRLRLVAEASVESSTSRTPSPQSPVPSPHLTLYLLPAPRRIEVRVEGRRDHVVPTAYQDGRDWYGIVSAAGPDRVSGERWNDAYAREYFRCVLDDGGLVWVFREAREGAWYLHGWWD